MSKVLPIILGLGIVGVVALVFLEKKAKAATPETPEVVEVPFDVDEMVEEINQATSLAELDAFYNYLGELFITGKISYTEYKACYDAYASRYNELAGVEL